MKVFKDNQHIEDWSRFLESNATKKYVKGEMIFLKDETPQKLCIIKSGVIKAYDIDNDGEEQEVSLDSDKEVFPIGWVLKIHEKTRYFYEAFTDAEVYLIDRQEFIDYISTHPKIAYEMYESLATRFVSMQTRVHALEQKKALDKIALTILYLCERFGKRVGDKSVKIQIPLSHKELSNFIGLTRETTSLTLKKLADEGILSYEGKVYIADTKKLKEIANT